MNWHDLHFLRPYWLIALLPLVVVFVLFLKRRFGQGEWAAVCDEDLLPYILDSVAPTKTRWMLGVLMGAALLSILALTGPTWERLETPTFSNNAALVIALDLSPTMNATDIKPSRLARARFKIADILRQRKDGLTALVVYSADAFTVTPLTHDTATIENQLNALESSIMPAAGKNTVVALTQSIQLLKQAGQQQGDVLLVTDAVESSDSDEVGGIGAYKISVLGVGTSDGGPVKMEQGGFLKDNQGNILLPRLNTPSLSAIAKNGSGMYVTISADDADINQLLSFFDRAVSSQAEQDNGLVEQWNDLGAWLLLLVLPLAALSFRKGFLMLCLLVVVPMPNTSYAVEWNDLWVSKNQQAQQAFKNKQFDKAAETFESPEWKAAAQYRAGNYQQVVEELSSVESADGLYNKGNAHAKLGDYEKAIETYEQALKVNPNNEDAKHNLKLVKDAQREQQKNQEQQDGDKDESEQQGKGNSQDESSADGEQQPSDKGQEEDGEKGKPEEPTDEETDSGKEESAKESNSADEASDSEPVEKMIAEPLSDEKKQAAEQWLNRIEDDPAGLLKRKFRYQYRQRREKE